MSEPSPELSLCMIVRDEARHLRACLRSVRPLISQLIVVDTGSVDDTPAIAAEFGAEISHFSWQNDFSAARNAALAQARCPWVMSLDADELLEPETLTRLPEVMAQWDPQAPYMHNWLAFAPGHKPVFTHGIFPRLPGLQFQGRVHEFLSLKGVPVAHQYHPELKILRQPIAPEQLRAKQVRYLPLIQAELAQSTPGTAVYQHYRWHLGLALEQLGRKAEALESWLQLWRDYAQGILKPQSARSLETLLQKIMPLLGELPAAAQEMEQLSQWFLEALPESILARHARAQALCEQGDFQGAYNLSLETLSKLPMTPQHQAHFGQLAAWARRQIQT